jgi:hypothetical protein
MIFLSASIVRFVDLGFGSCTSRLIPEVDLCGDNSQTTERAAAAVVAVAGAMVQWNWGEQREGSKDSRRDCWKFGIFTSNLFREVTCDK